VRQQLKVLLEAMAAQQVESSASRQRSERDRGVASSAHQPNLAPSQNQDRGGGVAATTSAVKSRLRPDCDARNTIEARRWAVSVDYHRDHDNHDRHHDDRGLGQHYDSDDNRDRNWTPNQRDQRAFGQSVRDTRFPSRFRAPTNVPRYDGDTNTSVWLKDYRLVCYAGGATDDLFIIKNLPLYLRDSARTWLEHLPHDKINNWADLRRVFVGNFQGTYTHPSKQWELSNCKQQPGESLHE
jgi:hypothetical protein